MGMGTGRVVNNPLDIYIPGDPPTPAQQAQSLVADYERLEADIRHGDIDPAQAQRRAHRLTQRAQIAGALPPDLAARVNAAKARFDDFWSQQGVGRVDTGSAPVRDLAAHRTRSARSPAANRRSLPGRMRRALRAMRRTPDFPQAVLQSLTEGMRPAQLAALAAHTTPQQLRGMARQAGATDAEAELMVRSFQTNAATAFHTMVRARAAHSLRDAEHALERLGRPAEVRSLVQQMLHGHMREGRDLVRQMLGGDSRRAVLDLLERYDTTPDPAERARIEAQLGPALRRGIQDAVHNVRHLRHEIRAGALSSATDTQLYALAPDAVRAVAGQLHLAPARARGMTTGEGASGSLLEAGVSEHVHEVHEEEHLREVTTTFAGWALALGASAITGGAGAALAAGLLRGVIRGGVRYGADSAAVAQAEAARAAGLVGQAEVARREATRHAHVGASAAEIMTEAALGGARLGAEADLERQASRAAVRAIEARGQRATAAAIERELVDQVEHAVDHGGGAHLLGHAAVELGEPLVPVGAEHAVEGVDHLAHGGEHESARAEAAAH